MIDSLFSLKKRAPRAPVRRMAIQRVKRCIEGIETELAILKVSLRQLEKGERMGTMMANVVSTATSIGTQARVILRTVDEIK